MAAHLSTLSLSVLKRRPSVILTAQKRIPPLRSPSPAFTLLGNLKPQVGFTKRWEISASNYDFLLAEANPVENPQELVPPSDDGVSSVISALLLIAFIGLSILTVGVIYIAVTDFLQKREGEKFEKEEAGKKKKGGRRGKVRARGRDGPRGFGQKIEEDDDIDVA